MLIKNGLIVSPGNQLEQPADHAYPETALLRPSQQQTVLLLIRTSRCWTLLHLSSRRD